MKRYLSTATYDPKRVQVLGERVGKLSLTLPDQALSIRDILDKYTKGLYDGVKAGFYDFDHEPGDENKSYDQYNTENVVPDWRTMGYSERSEYVARKRQELAQAELKLNQVKGELNEKARKAKAKAASEKEKETIRKYNEWLQTSGRLGIVGAPPSGDNSSTSTGIQE